jgi:adenosine deaminase
LYPVIFKFLFPVKNIDEIVDKSENKITLHGAIERLLQEKKQAMSAGEIANELNKNNWYVKRDGSNIKPSQISARVSKYQNIFDVDSSVSPHQIKLI